MVSGDGEQQVDLIIHARWVVPMRPDPRTVLSHHSIVIHRGKIISVEPTADLPYTSTTELHRPQHAVIPGLINAHTHSGMTLMRGCADDQTLHAWLRGRIWPIEAAFLAEPNFCHDGALLSAAEMTRGGITTFNDMYWDADAAARAVSHSGMRAVLGIILIAFPSAFGSNTEEYMRRGEAARERNDSSRITFAYAPHAPYTVPDDAWVEVARRARKSGAFIHTHLHETEDEVVASANLDRSSDACHMSDTSMRPLRNLERLGVLDVGLLAAHFAHATEDEIALCAKRDVRVAHCPTSNAKLAVGSCNAFALAEAGVTVALGTDSACSNNTLDMFAEMKAAALFAKSATGDAAKIPAHQALEMATMGGARALGLEKNVGSLEVGKCADIAVVELGTRAGNSPVYSVLSALVYAASRDDVSDVFVDGVCLLRDKKLRLINEKDICAKAQMWADRIEDKFPLGDPLAAQKLCNGKNRSAP